MRSLPAALLALLLVTALSGSATATSSPRYHTVATGQRLGSIAKRYRVAVEALCTANGIEKNSRIRPGQKLLVPNKGDEDGMLTRRLYGPPESKVAAPQKAKAAELAPAPQVHTVFPGQRLDSIARRYNVTVDALCSTNSIRRTTTLRPGQVLTIPGKLPELDGGQFLTRADEPNRTTARTLKRRGFVDLGTYTQRYRGVVFDKNGKVSATSVAAISKLFGAVGKRPRVDPRLIALLADVSSHFDGKPVRVVSGYRDHSYFEDSRHKHSQAVDFSIPGVSNTELRDYVRRFRNVGVGYYPNSTFVHLDVRESASYWVDYAGPGEEPRSRPRAEPKKRWARGDDSGPVEESQAEVDESAKAEERDAERGEHAPAEAAENDSAEAKRGEPSAAGEAATETASVREAAALRQGTASGKSDLAAGAAPTPSPH